MSTMTITIERTPRTLQFAGQSLQVEELSVRLPFARKPADLGELGGSDQHKVYVTETKELTLPNSTPLGAACWCHATGCVAGWRHWRRLPLRRGHCSRTPLPLRQSRGR